MFPTSYDSYIGSKRSDSKLIGHGKDIQSVAESYGIDPSLLLAIIAHESAWGTSNILKSDNNVGGITWNPSSMPAHWKGSPRSAIDPQTGKPEGGYYVKFPTIKDSIAFTAKTMTDIDRKNQANVVKPQTTVNGFSDSDLVKYAQTINLSNPVG